MTWQLSDIVHIFDPIYTCMVASSNTALFADSTESTQSIQVSWPEPSSKIDIPLRLDLCRVELVESQQIGKSSWGMLIILNWEFESLTNF